MLKTKANSITSTKVKSILLETENNRRLLWHYCPLFYTAVTIAREISTQKNNYA